MDYMIGFSYLVVTEVPADNGNNGNNSTNTTPPTTRTARVPSNNYFSVDGLAAVALAMRHLNTGDGSVVPQVQGLNERCNLQFQFAALDSYLNQTLAVNQIIADVNSDVENNNSKRSLPCAVLGNLLSSVTMATSMITSLQGYLQMSYSTATELDDRLLFPLATRIVHSLSTTTGVMIRYLREQLGVKHLAVLHTDTRESQSFSVALQQAAASLAPDLDLISIDIPDQWTTPDILKQAVTKLKETGFTYFVGAVAGRHLDELWEETVAQGIAGTGKHTWLLPSGGGSNWLREYILVDQHKKRRCTACISFLRVDMHRVPSFIAWRKPIFSPNYLSMPPGPMRFSTPWSKIQISSSYPILPVW
jgi:hypothetical protein